MPLHDFRCPNGHEFELVVPAGTEEVVCIRCSRLDVLAQKVFLCFPVAFVRADVHYRSPVTGEPITSAAQRQDDLRRQGCIAWEPGIKQDAARNRTAEDTALDQAVEATVDEFVATASPRKLEVLEQELRGGASVETVRSSPTGVVK